MRNQRSKRNGAIAVLLCVLLLPLLALIALFVDYGFLIYVRADLQRAADQATLAAVRDLVPDEYGNQDLAKVRQTLRDYLALNIDSDFVLLDSDIEIGRYNSNTIFNSVDLLDSGIFDTVRITVRRDSFANASVSLFFARIFDADESDVTARSTSILQRARYLEPGAAVFPVTIHVNTWNKMAQGDVTSVYGDGRIEDESGKPIAGNWGTVDIGSRSNSTTELSKQIRDGLTQDDLDSLYRQGAIPDSGYIDSEQTVLALNGDTGFSAGVKHAVAEAHGTTKMIPIYKKSSSKGGGLTYEIVDWGAVEIVDSSWNGNKNSYIQIRKTYRYDRYLRPNRSLGDIDNSIESVFTAPALAQ